MGFWLNNFADFERKVKRPNRLVLNFSYVPNGDNHEKPTKEKIKVYVPAKVTVPTWFLHPPNAEEVARKFGESEILRSFNLERRVIGTNGRYEVLKTEVPNFSPILDELKKIGFHTGNYVKTLRYQGFHPGRKAVLEERLISNSDSRGEIEIPDLSEIGFGDFLTLEEARKLPYVVLDIEKPLWKKPREKELIDLRKSLLAAKEDERTEQRKKIIGRIEKRLLWNDPEIEKSGFYEDKFNADVSYVGTIWVSGEERVKELYVIDSLGEVDAEEHNGFKILKFQNEKELIRALRASFRKRKPLVAIGHNQVYDYSQLRYASDEHKLVFDPVVNDVKSRRDFVLDFLQRQREDMIYIDTLWLGRIFYPYLNQRRFGTSFKLAELANHLGIDFKKSLTHEQLREVEMRRLAGKTSEIRKKAGEEMIDYACADLGGTEELFHRLNPWPILIEMKRVLPFCTYTEIAFSPNIMGRLHEYKHFAEAGNLPLSGFKRGEKRTELQVFKSKFPGMKKERLKSVCLKKASKGTYENVTEFYLSLEHWFLDFPFFRDNGLRELYFDLRDEHELASLQYLRAYMMPIFSDYVNVISSSNKNAAGRRFFAMHHCNSDEIRGRISEGYKTLAEDIRRNGMTYLDHIGDYIFVQGDGKLSHTVRIRTLEEFEVS